MSYLHCPTCLHAYNLAVQATCPFCPVPATAVDPAEDIVVAAEQLARALARASDAERGVAAARMAHLALPAPDAPPAKVRSEAVGADHAALLGAIHAVVAPPAPAPTPIDPPRRGLAALADAARWLAARADASPRLAALAGASRGLLVQLPMRPRLAAGLRRAAGAVRERVRALAA